MLWMNVTTLFALYPDQAWTQWDKVMKIQLMIFVTMLVMQTRQRIQWMVWVTVASLAFYGVKGGLYTLRGGGMGMVIGPPGGFIRRKHGNFPGDHDSSAADDVSDDDDHQALGAIRPRRGHRLVRRGGHRFLLTGRAARDPGNGRLLWLKSRKKLAPWRCSSSLRSHRSFSC